jgi:16S rRNA (guanine527-N7)-methyltransferase
MCEQAALDELKRLFGQAELPEKPGPEQIESMARLVGLLLKWNKALNLTAIKDPIEAARLHVMDSACVSPFITGKNVADIGTGAGFPGLVLAIMNPEKEFTLVDSVAKKISFVKNAAAVLGLKNANAVVSRAEKLKPEIKFDCVTCRAFAPLEKIVSICRHLVAENGIIVAMKANVADNELSAVKGASVERIAQIKVPGIDARRCAVMLRIE